MIKYIVTDMDGTLFFNHGDNIFDLSKDNKEGIDLAAKNNIKICTASGRMIEYGKKIANKYNIEKCLCGLNGAIIVDDNKIVEDYSIDINALNEIYLVYENNLDCIEDIQFQSTDSIRFFNNLNTEYAKKNIRNYNETGIGIVSNKRIFEIIDEKNIGKVSILIYENKSDCIIDKLQNIKGISFYFIKDNLIEITNEKVSKGNFIKYLIKSKNLNFNEIAVIGDADNDIDMAKYAGYVFAMRNSSEKYLKLSSYIVESVGECINKCIEINNELKG